MMRGQPLAAFGATALQNQAARFGTHAGTEAVRFGATTIVRLKGTLHLTYSPILILTEPQSAIWEKCEGTQLTFDMSRL